MPTPSYLSVRRIIKKKDRSDISARIHKVLDDKPYFEGNNLRLINVKRDYKYKDLADRVNKLTANTRRSLSSYKKNTDLMGYFSDFNDKNSSDNQLILSIQNQINEIITQSHGKALKDKKFQEILKQMNKIENAKHYQSFGDVVSDTEKQFFYFDLLKKNYAAFKLEANEFVAKTSRNNFADVDYSDIEALKTNNFNYIEKLEAVLQLFSYVHTSESIYKSLTNTIYKAENEINSKNEYIRNYQTQEFEIRKDLQELEESEKQAFSTTFNGVPVDDINKAVDNVNFIINSNIFLNRFNHQTPTFIGYLLKDCAGLTGDALRKKLDENEASYVNTPMDPYVSMVRGITDYALFVKGVTPQDLLNISDSPEKITEFRNDVIKDLNEKSKELKQLSERYSKNGSVPFYNEICNLVKNRQLAATYKKNLDFINEKYVSFNKENEKLYSKYNKRIKKKLNSYIDIVASHGANAASLEEVKKLLDSAKSEKEAYTLLKNAAKDVNKIYSAAVNDLTASLPEHTKEIKEFLDAVKNNDEKTIDIMLGNVPDETSAIHKKLKAAKLDKDKIDELEEKTSRFFERNHTFLIDMKIAHTIADNITQRFDSAIKNRILDDMVRIYKTLNDARKENHINSTSYNNMISPLCSILGKPIPVGGQNLHLEDVDISKQNISMEQLRETMTEIERNARDYLAEKGNLHLFSSGQAHQRHHLANQLISLVQNATQRIEFANNYKKTNVNNRLKDFRQCTDASLGNSQKELDQNLIIKAYNQSFDNKEVYKKLSESAEREERYKTLTNYLNKVKNNQANIKKKMAVKTTKNIINDKTIINTERNNISENKSRKLSMSL